MSALYASLFSSGDMVFFAAHLKFVADEVNDILQYFIVDLYGLKKPIRKKKMLEASLHPANLLVCPYARVLN